MKKVFTIIFLTTIAVNLFAQSFIKVTSPAQTYGLWKTTIELSPESAGEMLGPELNTVNCKSEVNLTLYMTIEKTKVKGITSITNSSEITFLLSSDSEFPSELIDIFSNRYKKKLYQLFEISNDKKNIKIKTRRMSEKFKYTDREFLTPAAYISTDKKILKMDFSEDGSNYIEFKKSM